MASLRYGHFQVETDAAGLPVRLGPGSMGTTYRALDTHLRKTVALKVIDERFLANPTSRRRFFNEARTAAQLEHPNIARVLYLCPEDAKTCFFAMELVDGETLGERVARLGPCSASEALALLRPVADALACLGRHKLVHRDVKPENIMLGKDPRGNVRVKLIDFGLAKSVDARASSMEPVESGETFFGSSYFASPEQVRSRETLDHRSDFYSLGATLWHALTGAPPFTGATFEVHEGHVNRQPPWEKIGTQPEAVRDLLKALLAKDAAARPRDAAELARLWDAATVAVAVAVPAPSPKPAAKPVLTSPSVGSRLRWKRAEAVPHGCSAPPFSGFLARDAETNGWYFIRPLPPALPESIRAEIVDGARRALDAPLEGARPVLEVLDECIVSEWRRGVSLAHFLAVAGKGLTLELVLPWLPPIAEVLDFATEHSLGGISLQLSNVWLEFEQSADGRAPLEIAMLPPAEWGRHSARIGLLGAFDPMLESLAVRGIVPEAAPSAAVAAEPLPHFAALIYRVLGGDESPTGSALEPIHDLDGARNRLLIETIEGRSQITTAREWVAAFCEGRQPQPIAADLVPTPLEKRVAPSRWPILAGVCALAVTLFFMLRGSDEKPAPAPDPEPTPHADWRSAKPSVPTLDGGTRVVEKKPAAPEQVEILPAPKVLTPESARPPADFVNTLGMRFKSCRIVASVENEAILVSVWETRRADYAPFARATGRPMPATSNTGPAAGLDPVAAVSWNDSRDFCAWLTNDEIAAGKLDAHWRYRLPTDHEWSSLIGIAGMNDEWPGIPLWQKHLKLLGRYMWGSDWPPRALIGNIADVSAARAHSDWKTVGGYDDGFPEVASVGSFAPDKNGIFDLVGNVMEWCADTPEFDPGNKVLRGGSFARGDRQTLLACFRVAMLQNAKATDAGFRIVLVQRK